MTINLSAKFEPNRWFEYYHLLPGPIVDTLLSRFAKVPSRSSLQNVPSGQEDEKFQVLTLKVDALNPLDS